MPVIGNGIRKLTWEQYFQLVYALGETIKEREKSLFNGLNIKYLYGVPRGGTLISILLSHRLNIPWGIGLETVLFIDDVVDSGKTLIEMKERNAMVVTASLFVKPWSVIKPNLHLEETDQVIIFPYENEGEFKINPFRH